MAFNKNFVVKNGLQVADKLLYAADIDNRVGINTNSPAYTFDVIGGIGASNVTVSGMSTFQAFTVGFATFSNTTQFIGGNLSISNNGVSVSAPSTFTSPVVINGTSLTVSGVTTFNTANTFNGISTFSNWVNIQSDLNVSGVATAGYFYGDLVGIANTATNVSGGTASVSTLAVAGVSTITNGPLLVGSGSSTGTASQVVQASGGAYVSGNLGVGDTNPTAKLRVVGDGSFTGVITATTFNGNLSGTAATVTNFYGSLTGNVTGDVTGTATTSTNINISAITSTDSTAYPLLVGDNTATGQTVFIDNVDLSYNASTGALSATTFIGNLTGTASTATAAGIANTTTFITVADESSDTTCFPLFATSSTGDQAPKTDASALTYNASSGTLSAVGFAGTFFANGLSNFASNTVEKLIIKNYVETLNPIGNTGAAATIDLANGNFVTATLTDNCVFTFTTGITTGASAFTIVLSQDAVGNRAVTWPVTVDWPQGSNPGITTAANAVDIFVFFSADNGSTWYGNITHADIK